MFKLFNDYIAVLRASLEAKDRVIEACDRHRELQARLIAIQAEQIANLERIVAAQEELIRIGNRR